MNTLSSIQNHSFYKKNTVATVSIASRLTTPTVTLSVGTPTTNNTIQGWAISNGGKVVLYWTGAYDSTASPPQTIYMNDGNGGTTFSSITSKLQYFWTGAKGLIMSITVSGDGNTIIIGMRNTGTSGSTSTASGSPAFYYSTNAGSTFTLTTTVSGNVTFLGSPGGVAYMSGDNNWCFVSPAISYSQSVFINQSAGNFSLMLIITAVMGKVLVIVLVVVVTIFLQCILQVVGLMLMHFAKSQVEEQQH